MLRIKLLSTTRNQALNKNELVWSEEGEKQGVKNKQTIDEEGVEVEK